MNSKFLLTLTVLLISHQSSAQFPSNLPRFIVNVVEFTIPNVSNVNFRCVGTVISNRRVLTTASCVNVGVGRALAVQAIATTGQTSQTIFEPVIRISIHPDFVEGKNNLGNVAVLLIPPRFTGTFSLRPPGQLAQDLECRLYGWGGEFLDARNEVVKISSPDNCDPDSPQAYCTVFESPSDSSCNAFLGSPLICGENSSVGGFVINEGGCITANGKVMLKYHNVGEFFDWIAPAEALNSVSENSARFMAFVGRFTTDISTITDVCSAVIIGERNVLTAASCVRNLDGNQRIAVRYSFISGGVTTTSVSRVTIHPTADIALVRGGLFDDPDYFNISSIVAFPQPLPDWCYLYGFGISRASLRRDPIKISPATTCNPNNPDNFCALLSATSHGSCNARTGSPVICGDEPNVAGILISNNGCELIDGRARLDFVALNEYREWIVENNVNHGVMKKLSIFLILSSILITTLKFY